MLHFLTLKNIFLFISIIPALVGCTTFNPRPVEQVPFRERAQTKNEGNISVTAAVPSAAESRQLFGVSVYKRGVQPVWLEIENNDEEAVYFLPIGVDPAYFSPFEASFTNHFTYWTPINDEIDRTFFQRRQGIRIGPKTKRTGFVYTPVDEGTKEFNVDIIGEDREVRTFTFFINVPGLRIDHHEVDFDSLYSQEEITSYDASGLRMALEELPCCTADKEGAEEGDPLNFIVIGDVDDVLYSFVRAGWDETETVYKTSAFKTALSFIFGGRYRYSPVSALYVFGRKQDAALQRARETIHERNHLRVWLSPLRFEGKMVWVGQISRDIGVRFSSKTIMTHKIDPDVDETRDYLVQNLWYSQGLSRLAFVKGVGAATIGSPRYNLTGDAYFTDGLRAVLWVSSNPVDLEEIEFLQWEIPSKNEISK